MDYHFSYQQNPRRSQWMDNFSLFLGIMAITGICIGPPALIGGSLAIVFALLSRGGEMTMSSRSMVGLTLGIISLVIMILLFIFVFYMMISYYGGLLNVPANYNQIMHDMYDLLNDFTNQLLPAV